MDISCQVNEYLPCLRKQEAGSEGLKETDLNIVQRLVFIASSEKSRILSALIFEAVHLNDIEGICL